MTVIEIAKIESKPTLSVNEAAALSGFSRDTITRLFSEAKGVIVLNRPEKLHKRRYRTIKIPRPVYDRVIGGISK